MSSVPPPPVLGPLTIAPSNAAPPGFSGLVIYRWDTITNSWGSLRWLQIGWDAWPAGYYASAHLNVDGNVDWGPHSTVIVVVARTTPDGLSAPYVLEPPPPGSVASPDCPPNMYLTDIGNQFGDKGPMCAVLGPPPLVITIPILPVIPVLPEPPPPPPPPPLGDPDPYGDEITFTLCSQMRANTTAIVYAIEQLQLQMGDGSGDSSTCCKNLVIALTGITMTLTEIFNLLSKSLAGSGTPLDLSPIVGQLTCICTALTTLSATPPIDLAPVTVALDKIASAVAGAPGTDVSQIVDQLKTIAGQGDVDQAIIDALQQQGLITPADLQVLQGIKWSDAIAYALSSAPVRAVWKFCKQIGADAEAITNSITNYNDIAVNFAESLVGKAFAGQRKELIPPIKKLLADVLTSVKPTGPVTLGNIQVDPDAALAGVATAMLDFKLLGMLVGIFREGAAEQLDHLAEKILAIVGLEEIREVQLGPLVRNGMAQIAEYQAKAIFQQEIVGAGELTNLVARGILSPGDITGMLDFNGLAPILRAPLQQSAYRGMNARQMLRLIETNLFTSADIADELTFSGMRPVSQHRMIMAAPYLATATYRHQLHAALEAAHVAGLLSDTDLTSRVDSAEHNTDRDSLILERVKLIELVAETKALETEYTTLFKSGLMDDPTYRANLAGLTLQRWKVDAIAGVAEASANATLQRKTIAEAAALARTTAAEERKAAMESFKSGVANETALAAALVLTGLTPTQAAAWVSLATLQRSGSLRWIYGLLKSPTEAALLRQRISALADQRKRLQIDDPTFVAALQAIGISDRYINALRAATNALITPKTAAVTIPVQTT